MECLLSLVRLRNTGLVNAGKYRVAVEVSLDGLAAENVAVVHWNRDPVSYSVRGRAVVKPPELSEPDGAFASSSTIHIEYDEEDANLSESCLFHFNVSAIDLLDRCTAPSQLWFTLEYCEDSGQFVAVGKPVRLVLEGDRYGLINECAFVYFTSPLYGSASLELSVFFASLLGHCRPEDAFSEEELNLDAGDHFTVAARKQMKRRLALYISPYAYSLARLRQFVGFCASSYSSSSLVSSFASSSLGPLPVSAPATQEEYAEDDLVSVRQRCEEMKDERSESFLLWHRVQTIFATERETLFDISRERWMQRAKDLAGEWSLREKITTPKSLLFPQDAEERARHCRAVAERLRLAPRFSDYNAEGHTFAGEGMFVDYKGRPVVFEQRFEGQLLGGQSRAEAAADEGGIHLIVLLHGFLGSRWDLKVFQLVLASLEIPGVRCRAMACNEDKSEESLQVQGHLLGEEILAFAADKQIARLSFVAYSMGAVVARMALNHPGMQRKFKHKLYTFVSVAGPHLGSAGGDSALVGVGQWVFRRWKKILSLAQLALEDDTLLLLAKQSDMLGEFRTVALVSSSSDAYVPSFSARMEIPATGVNPKIAEMQRALCKNLMRVKTLSKIELDFEFEVQSTKQKMDVLLGRAAHVHILDSVPLTLTLMLNYCDEWFK